MPYITPPQRQKLDKDPRPTDAGELNYTITRYLLSYLEDKGLKYSTLNEIMGVLNCVTQEFYRRWAAPYEDLKIRDNGDVGPFPREISTPK
ncbi:MAG: hypothetical protein K8R69_00845 [Deltaproteobacteria bacterium]|nr:hypothetical protein [Deltaproteobacteria bacterium]